MSLQLLAQFAVAQNFKAGSASRTPLEDLSIEEARATVKVGDGNKKPAEDGSKALVLRFGKTTLALDVIAAGATRVNATAEQVEEFTKVLEAEVAAGSFDAAIVAAQARIREGKAAAAAKPKTQTATTVPEPSAEETADSVAPAADIDGLDLSSL